MSARALSVLTVGAALLIAGCSSSEGGTALPASSSAATGSTTAPTTAAAPTTTSNPPSTSTQPATSAVSSSVEGAVQRYETFLGAIGREDVTTVCEIAGPAAKKAEDEGFGTCEQTIPITFQMISATQKRALRSATVDESRITKDSATKVEIPASAVKASVKFTDSDLGDATMEYRGGKWYVVDN
ncbi:hypothetical protein [Amycolatopsis sp. NPDC051903]|uniref:hypothetical protein n=1 Tax=Amycolatopsis sp. NPDC051903 TaxID=3363936 RepID=UPI0037AB1727